MGGRRLTEHENGVICGMVKAGKGIRETARELNVAMQTVRRVAKKIKKESKSKGKQRPPKISEQLGRRVVRMVKEARPRAMWATEVQAELAGEGYDISRRTISRFLKAEGYTKHQRKKKSALSSALLKLRLQFCKKYRKVAADWAAARKKEPADYWQETIHMWCDGKNFRHEPTPSDRALGQDKCILCKDDEVLNNDIIGKGKLEEVRDGNKGEWYFIGMCGNGKVPLAAKTRGTSMDGEEFAALVKRDLIPALKRAYPNHKATKADPWVLIQDFDSAQRSPEAEVAFAKCNISMHEWPRRGGDLMCEENLWRDITTRLRKGAPQGRETFKPWAARLHAAIVDTPASVVEKLIRSMPRRMKECIDAKGGRIRY